LGLFSFYAPITYNSYPMTFGHVTLFDIVVNSIEIIGMVWVSYKQDRMLDQIEQLLKKEDQELKQLTDIRG